MTIQPYCLIFQLKNRNLIMYNHIDIFYAFIIKSLKLIWIKPKLDIRFSAMSLALLAELFLWLKLPIYCRKILLTLTLRSSPQIRQSEIYKSSLEASKFLDSILKLQRKTSKRNLRILKLGFNIISMNLGSTLTKRRRCQT